MLEFNRVMKQWFITAGFDWTEINQTIEFTDEEKKRLDSVRKRKCPYIYLP